MCFQDSMHNVQQKRLCIPLLMLQEIQLTAYFLLLSFFVLKMYKHNSALGNLDNTLLFGVGKIGQRKMF